MSWWETDVGPQGWGDELGVASGCGLGALKTHHLLYEFFKTTYVIYFFRLSRVLVVTLGIWFPDHGLSLGPLT